MNRFDSYYSLLDIPPQDQPPDYYRLLSINRREENTDVIEAAADRRMELLKPHESGDHMHEVATLLSEVSRARLCLTDPIKKASYDASLNKAKGGEIDLYDSPSNSLETRAKRKRLLLGLLFGGLGFTSILVVLVLVLVIRNSGREEDRASASNKLRQTAREEIANSKWSKNVDRESNLTKDGVTDGQKSTSNSPTAASGRPDFGVDVSDNRLVETAGPATRNTIVVIDETHNNLHTLAGLYRPFAELLAKNDYTVSTFTKPFKMDALAGVGVLVISNALGDENVKDWKLPAVTAFTNDEINVVESWVRSGGVLLLIADHAPYSGAAADMAARFGFKFENGFAGSARNAKPKLFFQRAKGELASHPITDGSNNEERINKIMTFSGSAFQFDANSTSLLTFGSANYFYNSTTPPRVTKDTPKLSLQGWSQGAVRAYGRGRVAVFGEAAMFTNRSGSNGKLNGFSAPGAEDNAQFVLNLFTWLTDSSLP